MVEMHLLNVNSDFQYNPIYSLGVVTAFDRFMQGYLPESDRDSIFQALIRAQNQDPQQYQADAKALCEIAQESTSQELQQWASQAAQTAEGNPVQNNFQAIATNSRFKYSRLLAIGLYTLLEQADTEILQDKDNREQAIETMASGLNLSKDKLLKDLELYRSNLDKVAQARKMMQELTEAERKKREQREAARATEGVDENSEKTQSPSES